MQFIRISCFIVLLAAFSAPAFAQAPADPAQGPLSGQLSDKKPLPPPVDAAAIKAASTAPAPESTVPKSEPFRRSFFFSPADLLAIDKALRGVISDSVVSDQNVGVIPQVRTISLQGIYYKSPTNWMIWLNNRKVAPGAPRQAEIQDLIVEPGVIHLKWFDIGANAVLSLDMRPHEVYDIVTGVALPDQTPVKLEGGKP